MSDPVSQAFAPAVAKHDAMDWLKAVAHPPADTWGGQAGGLGWGFNAGTYTLGAVSGS